MRLCEGLCRFAEDVAKPPSKASGGTKRAGGGGGGGGQRGAASYVPREGDRVMSHYGMVRARAYAAGRPRGAKEQGPG